jgi:nicotinamidase/pyrazinamidase
LRERGVDTVHVVGLALDYCVKATALDARQAGFEVVVHRRRDARGERRAG